MKRVLLFLGRTGRAVAIVIPAQLFTGITIGLCGRLLMRVIALTDEDPGTLLTFGGTSAIVVIVTVLGFVPALLFVTLRHALPGSDLRKGLILGAGLVIVGMPFVFREAVGSGIAGLNVAMFAALLLANGVLLSLAIGWLDRTIPSRSRRGDPAVSVPL